MALKISFFLWLKDDDPFDDGDKDEGGELELFELVNDVVPVVPRMG